MKRIRLGDDRGFFDFGWLKTFHSFSFGDYFDPENTEFHELRVINEDFVRAGAGFPTHPHRDMEIVTYVLSGALEHKDSMGNGSTIRAGDVQYMSAGSGVTHSEFNPSKNEDIHLMQIWIKPKASEKGAVPRYDQKKFSEESKIGKWKLIVSPDGSEDSIAIRQDAKIYASLLPAGTKMEFPINSKRGYWIHAVKGVLQVGDLKLETGDALALENEKSLTLQNLGSDQAEILLFDLP